MTSPAAVFAAVIAALYVGHQVGDYWVQTAHQAVAKTGPGWAGRLACARHVATLTVTQLVLLGAVEDAVGVRLDPIHLAAGVAVNAASHWWADRRHTLDALAALLDRTVSPGKASFLTVGQPPLATGAHALDQSWHLLWLAVAALIVAA